MPRAPPAKRSSIPALSSSRGRARSSSGRPPAPRSSGRLTNSARLKACVPMSPTRRPARCAGSVRQSACFCPVASSFVVSQSCAIFHLHDADRAELAGRHHLARLPHHRVAGVVVRQDEHAVRSPPRPRQVERVLERRGQRLVADHVDAGLQERPRRPACMWFGVTIATTSMPSGRPPPASPSPRSRRSGARREAQIRRRLRHALRHRPTAHRRPARSGRPCRAAMRCTPPMKAPRRRRPCPAAAGAARCVLLALIVMSGDPQQPAIGR